MSRFARTTAVALMSALTFAGAGYPASAMQKVDRELTTMQSPRFDVIELSSVAKSDPVYSQFISLNPATSPKVQSLQASIMADKALTRDLSAQAVEINNIVGAQHAADGSVTFYVR